jgi:putative iron-regulated protein
MGYHAIEFLLWGQDLNGTGRRRQPARHRLQTSQLHWRQLRAPPRLSRRRHPDLLVDDLEDMAQKWGPDGAARKDVIGKGPDGGLATILTGIGSLSYGELAGERIKLGLILHDPEEEHDCFSDNTHNSHYYDVLGIQNVYTASYTRIDGSKVEGDSVASLVREKDAALADEMEAKLTETVKAAEALKARAEDGEAYDQMIGEGNAEGNAVVQAVIDGLVAQTRSLERVIAALSVTDVTIEGSDSLDNPDEVFK